MTNYKENVMQSVKALCKPEVLGVFTLSISVSIPSLGSPISRFKSVTLATWRNVSRDDCYELKERFFKHNDEYDFRGGVVSGKWQVIEYI